MDLFEPIKEKIENVLQVFGTCAGLLLLEKQIHNDDRCHLAAMNIKAVRNAYGRQLGNSYTIAELKGIGSIPMTFIRVPYIGSVSDGTETLTTVDDKNAAAREKNQFVTAVHPELTEDTRVYQYFLDIVKGANHEYIRR